MESLTSVERISSIIVLVLAVLIVRENRRGAKVVKSDPSIQLQSNQRFRTLTMQVLEPVLASWSSGRCW